MHLSRWVQSHLSDKQFKNISLLPFRVTIKSGRFEAERNVVHHQHRLYRSWAEVAKMTVLSRQCSRNREDFANLVTIRCSREQLEQLEMLNHITVLVQSSSG